jgi:hypothetical protein
MRCGRCGTVNPAEARFCMACGAPLRRGRRIWPLVLMLGELGGLILGMGLLASLLMGLGPRSAYGVAFSPDGRLVAAGDGDRPVISWGAVILWDVETGRRVRTLIGHTDRVLSVAFSPDGRLLASGSEDDTVILWDAKTGRRVRTLKGHTDDVNSVAFSPDGRLLASGS